MTESAFKLKEEFINQYKGKQPKWGEVGYVVYKRSYSRSVCKKCGSYNIDADKDWNTFCGECKSKNITSEEYWQTCKRVVEGTFSAQKKHCENYRLYWNERKAQNSAQQMYQRLWEFKFTPPGRGFEFMGTKKAEITGMVLNNCGFISTENLTTEYPEPFCFMMDSSMLGVGIGFDTKGANKITIREPKINGTFIVEDSREGWVELLRTLLGAYYYGDKELPSEVDYSQLRPKGAPLKTMGGVSSGPEPLIEMYNDIKKLLDSRIGQKLSSSDITDIMNLVGKCVVAGGRRRSAQIVFGNPNDQEFIELKDPIKNQEQLNHHRWASNNSIYAEIGMNYENAASLTAKNGEPGYLWLENARKFSRMNGVVDWKDERVSGANPCNEQSLESWELCCLVETYMVSHDSLEEWKETLKYAFMYGKTVSLIPTHNQKTNSVMNRNHRMGVSISGITQAFKKFGRRNVLNAMKEGYEIIQHWDKIYSEWFGVPRSIKTTSVKPSGSVSLLMGASPGIHYHTSGEYYIRRIRFEDTSPLLQPLIDAGYHVEKDAYAPNTFVVDFPIHEKYFDRCQSEVSMWEQLEVAAQVQECWADNQVSVTVKFHEHEADQIKYALELYETRLKGVSFLPHTNHGYKQAPYEEITKEQYEKLIKNIKQVKFRGETHEISEKFCDGEVCELPIEE